LIEDHLDWHRASQVQIWWGGKRQGDQGVSRRSQHSRDFGKDSRD
jgi:hypothetical protein